MKTSLLLAIFVLSTTTLACGGGADDRGDPSIGSPTPSSDEEAAPGSSGSPGASPAPGASPSACAATEPCIEADVTMTDGTTFRFAHPAVLVRHDGSVSLNAHDLDAQFGISITFKPALLVAGQAYPSKTASPVWMSVYRAHPTNPGKMRMSSAERGTIVFDDAVTPAGDDAVGTFDGVVVERDDPEDAVKITLAAGRFRASGMN
jgi:hypothetical protein